MGVLMYPVRSSYCHSLIPGSKQMVIANWLHPNIRHWTPYNLVLSSPLWRGMFVTIFSFHSSESVCLEPKFFSTHFFRSNGNAATGMRPVDATSYINIMQRKTLLKTLNHLYSIMDTGLIARPQPLTFPTCQLSCIFLHITFKFKPFIFFFFLLRFNRLFDEEYFLTDWSIC